MCAEVSYSSGTVWFPLVLKGDRRAILFDSGALSENKLLKENSFSLSDSLVKPLCVRVPACVCVCVSE